MMYIFSFLVDANWDEIDKLFNNKTIEGKKDLNEAREDVFSQKGMACFLESLVKHVSYVSFLIIVIDRTLEIDIFK